MSQANEEANMSYLKPASRPYLRDTMEREALESEAIARKSTEERDTMALPTTEAPAIEALLTHLTGSDRRETVTANMCIPAPIGCGGNAASFKDTISAKEYTISGLCQSCQDGIFG